MFTVNRITEPSRKNFRLLDNQKSTTPLHSPSYKIAVILAPYILLRPYKRRDALSSTYLSTPMSVIQMNSNGVQFGNDDTLFIIFSETGFTQKSSVRRGAQQTICEMNPIIFEMAAK